MFAESHFQTETTLLALLKVLATEMGAVVPLPNKFQPAATDTEDVAFCAIVLNGIKQKASKRDTKRCLIAICNLRWAIFIN